jgi:cytochrome c biogenesis protein CcmG, thiol:disulfide interchange protein DsbE
MPVDTILLRLSANPVRWRGLILGVALLGAAWIWATRAPQLPVDSTASPHAGFSAPDFTLQTLSGQDVTLSKLRGQAVVINLWASWCLPCRAEMPELDQVYAAYKGRGLTVLAVNSTFQDTESDARDFVQTLGLTMPVLLDLTGVVSRRYLLRALPTTFFVDRRGVIQDEIVGGPMSRAVIESKVAQIMAP